MYVGVNKWYMRRSQSFSSLQRNKGDEEYLDLEEEEEGDGVSVINEYEKHEK